MSEPSSIPNPPPTPANERAPGTLDVIETAARAVLPLVRLLPPPEGAILTPPEYSEPQRRSWLFVQIWVELRLAMRMYFDPRYRVSRLAQLAFPLFALLLVLNYFTFSVWLSIPFVSPIAERVIDVFLAILAYQVLTRELARYRAVLEYLARYTQR